MQFLAPWVQYLRKELAVRKYKVSWWQMAKEFMSPYLIILFVEFLVFNIVLHQEYLVYLTGIFRESWLCYGPSIFGSGIFVTWYREWIVSMSCTNEKNCKQRFAYCPVITFVVFFAFCLGVDEKNNLCTQTLDSLSGCRFGREPLSRKLFE